MTCTSETGIDHSHQMLFLASRGLSWAMSARITKPGVGRIEKVGLCLTTDSDLKRCAKQTGVAAGRPGR